MNKLNSIAISDPSQVEVMRHIYNENLESLSTKTLPYRTYEAQQQWWDENKRNLRAFLYEPVERHGTMVGFLVLRDRGGFYTPTIALRKEEWGNGYGKEIVYDYIQKANGPMAGSQLKSNAAICHLNKKAGWQVLGERAEESGMIELLVHPGTDPQKEITPSVFAAILDYLDMKPTDIPKDQKNSHE
jgi:RimJ/RimL family protein N-acetyltransferase